MCKINQCKAKMLIVIIMCFSCGIVAHKGKHTFFAVESIAQYCGIVVIKIYITKS